MPRPDGRRADPVADRPSGGASPPVIALRGVTKRFPGVIANDAISLDIRAGEIHVLLGENGAGKSTLIALLAGLGQPDSGDILVRGDPVRIGSPRDSLELGIGVVFQHALLVPSLSVLHNLMLGGPWWRALARDPVLQRFRELSTMLGVSIDPDSPVGGLSPGQQQQVEIIRALWRDADVLILDEPTSMLTPQGVDDLGVVLQRLRDAGVAILFVTHKMREALAFGDRVSVLRYGRRAGGLEPSELAGLTEAAATEAIIRLMFGATPADAEPARARDENAGPVVDRSGPPILSLRGLSTRADRGECPLGGIDLDLWPGEVLGIAGVDGNGQKHLAEVIAGQRGVVGGAILFKGVDVSRAGVAGRRRDGIAYITDERLSEGTVGGFSVATNLVLKEIGRAPLWWRGMTRWDRVNAEARETVARHDVRTLSERTPIGKLSGGNIQKVLLAREMTATTSVVVFNKPTHGLDLQNTRLARARILSAARDGRAMIVISNELDELRAVSDRIAVLFQGRLAGVVANGADVERVIGRMMTGAAA